MLDDLGAQKPNEWVWDTVALILNTRYNDKLTTIITTNYPDLPAGAGFKTDSEGKPAARGHPGRPHRRPHVVPSGRDVHPGRNDWQRLPPDRQARPIRLMAVFACYREPQKSPV